MTKTLKRFNKDSAITFSYLRKYYAARDYTLAEMLQQFSGYIACVLVQASPDVDALDNNLNLIDGIIRGLSVEYLQEMNKK